MESLEILWKTGPIINFRSFFQELRTALRQLGQIVLDLRDKALSTRQILLSCLETALSKGVPLAFAGKGVEFTGRD
jgi:hypothetical protein